VASNGKTSEKATAVWGVGKRVAPTAPRVVLPDAEPRTQTASNEVRTSEETTRVRQPKNFTAAMQVARNVVVCNYKVLESQIKRWQPEHVIMVDLPVPENGPYVTHVINTPNSIDMGIRGLQKKQEIEAFLQVVEDYFTEFDENEEVKILVCDWNGSEKSLLVAAMIHQKRTQRKIDYNTALRQVLEKSGQRCRWKS
jgi:hypothetical protein